RVRPPDAQKRLLDEPGDENNVEGEAAGGDRGRRRARRVRSGLPDGSLLERLHEEREDLGRGDERARLDRLEILEARGGIRELLVAGEPS
ncbi:MAG: hypothetical protein IPP07_29765, partial [Holophagales bacterium]|nr:hypothetical protein [Holophagales bacterium]